MNISAKRWMACLAVLATPVLGHAQSCNAQTWQHGSTYRLGDVVRYSNGNYYKVVNAGANGSDYTDPTISTWYWQPTSCSSSGGGTGGGSGGTCNAATWQHGSTYRLGDVVRYSNGNYYKVVNVGANGSDYTDPTISTWYWQPTSCEGSGGGGDGGGDGGNPGGGGSFIVSEAQFNSMFPGRNPFYTYSGLVNALSAYPAFANTGNDTQRKQEAAAFLANIAHESDQLRATREYNTANWPHYCSTEWGNTCAPGQQYYGRGPMQLSWNYNYKAAGDALGINLWANPDLVATDATIAWKTAIWYWMTGTGAAGMTPHAAIVNGHGFGMTIRAINGSLECNGGRPDQVQTRINFYNSFTQIIGVPAGGNLGC
ncbi:chitinase [Aquabacterium sp. A7-Y]|uniref:glycoside hydrolase family 19 protein n=1 Tax=Aquabacterium sp. A7-Y TaxID=1349605 RepID=UPI00223CCEB0|nr:glycoside hydrolase family 19 protein [Aquabacterium sp. A7-Y]MCW7536811.1 chitinase [Aquabacterium sp. A7-Y]